MVTARQSRHRCFQPEPVEISAIWTIEGKRYQARLRHAPIHEALALNVQGQNSVGHMALEEHGISITDSRNGFACNVAEDGDDGTGRCNCTPNLGYYFTARLNFIKFQQCAIASCARFS